MSISVKQMDEGFLQVTNNEVDRITLGMQFRSDMEARSLMGLLQQCAAPGTIVDISIFHLLIWEKLHSYWKVM